MTVVTTLVADSSVKNKLKSQNIDTPVCKYRKHWNTTIQIYIVCKHLSSLWCKKKNRHAKNDFYHARHTNSISEFLPIFIFSQKITLHNWSKTNEWLTQNCASVTQVDLTLSSTRVIGKSARKTEEERSKTRLATYELKIKLLLPEQE